MFKKAAASYEKYLLLNPKSAITHSNLAEIYNDNLNDPLMAIYHFRKFLEYEPESPDAKVVKVWIEEAEKQYAKAIRSKYPNVFTADAELLALKDRELKYREYIIKLKDWNAKLLNKNKTTKTSSENSAYSTYVVRSGDTLTMISRKIYGTSKYHKNIFNANRDILATESALNVGQKLKIPEIEGMPKQQHDE
jgi:nucleoid-associated protein YgaU